MRIVQVQVHEFTIEVLIGNIRKAHFLCTLLCFSRQTVFQVLISCDGDSEDVQAAHYKLSANEVHFNGHFVLLPTRSGVLVDSEVLIVSCLFLT